MGVDQNSNDMSIQMLVVVLIDVSAIRLILNPDIAFVCTDYCTLTAALTVTEFFFFS